MFRGVSKISVDAKGRIVIPAKYREQLRALAGDKVVVTIDRDGCLLIYPEPVWGPIEHGLKSLPTQHEPSRALQRLMIGYADEFKIDKLGRLQLTEELRERGGLQCEEPAVLVGQGERFELWHVERWEKRLAQDIATASASGVTEPPEEWKKARW